MAAETLKLDLALIGVVGLPLFRDSYPDHKFSRYLCDSTLEVLARRARTGGQHMRHSGQRSVALGIVVDDKAACALASGDCDSSPGILV
jgi:hypothetical protein